MKQDTCIHYNGMHSGNAACKAGIVYRMLPKPEPCWQRIHGQTGTDEERLARCAQFRLPTREECEAYEAQRDKEIAELLQQMHAREASGACWQCGKPLTAKQQVGRCIDAEPCGCRLGQGQLTHEGRRVQRVVVAQRQEEG